MLAKIKHKDQLTFSSRLTEKIKLFNKKPFNKQVSQLECIEGQLEVFDDFNPVQSNCRTTGYTHLDAHLHYRGWSEYGLTEIFVEEDQHPELYLLAPKLAQVAKDKQRIAFVAPPFLPYTPLLDQMNIPSEQALWFRPTNIVNLDNIVEQIAQLPDCSTLLVWTGGLKLGKKCLQRIIDIASKYKVWISLVRYSHQLEDSSLADAKVQLKLLSNKQLKVHILKQPGGWGGQTLTFNSSLELITHMKLVSQYIS